MRRMLLATVVIAGLGFTQAAHAQGALLSTRDVVVDVVPAGSPSSRLPVPVEPPSAKSFPSFNSQQLDRQLQRYMAYLEQYGTPDILIVGSSRALQGVDPLVLQRTLGQREPNLKVFNFGINGATAQVVDWLLHNLIPPDQLPRLIVWADGSRAFNSGRIDHTFNNIMASQGHQKLLAGHRPVLQVASSLKLGQVCMDLLPVPFLNLPPAAPNVKNSTGASSLERSPASICKKPLKLLIRQTGEKTPPTPETLGLQVVETQFNPGRYFQRFPKVPGNFDADYRDFNLGGGQARSLQRVAKFAHDRNISLVVVNLPLTTTYLDPTRSRYEAQFRRQMQQLAQAQGFVFTDLSQIQALMQDRYFADPSHINRFGAEAVADRLALELKPIWGSQIRHLSQTEGRLKSPNGACLYACLNFPPLLESQF